MQPGAGAPRRRGMLHRTSKLIGKEVKNTQNENLGSIHDLVLTSDHQQVSYAALSSGGTCGHRRQVLRRSLVGAPGEPAGRRHHVDQQEPARSGARVRQEQLAGTAQLATDLLDGPGARRPDSQSQIGNTQRGTTGQSTSDATGPDIHQTRTPASGTSDTDRTTERAERADGQPAAGNDGHRHGTGRRRAGPARAWAPTRWRRAGTSSIAG